jgi:hydrogenase expression/formation protein HypD
MTNAAQWLARIRALALSPAFRIMPTFRIMNVCGGHERSITMAGLRRALPASIELIPGPGCPVCVCPEELIHHAIQIALVDRATLVCFGDMLRVPVNVAKGEVRTLEQARGAGGDVRPIASPLEAVRIARELPDRPVVFFAAGFETTAAPVAAMLAEGVPDNLFVLLATRLTWPVVSMLLNSGEAGFDALIAPGHVATVMGPEEWAAVPAVHGKPAAIAGFTPESLLAAIYSVLRQAAEGRCFLDNCYPELVRPGGNPAARAQLARTMRVSEANWRGIGIIPASGLELADGWRQHDAARRFPEVATPGRKPAGGMPPGCGCAGVVLGRLAAD